MSYILDALRKADQQRQHGKAPTLLSAQSAPEAPKPSRLVFNIGLALVLIGAGIFIGWLQPWQSPQPTNLLPQSAVQTPAVVANTPAALAQSLIGRTAKPAAPAAPVTPIDSQPAADTPISPDPGSDSPRTAVTTKPTSPEPAQTVKENSRLTLAELPTDIRQQLPNISIAFHQYSPLPAERRVMINNLVLKQGDTIAPGLMLDKITPEGVVLSYMGYQFARGVR